MQTFDQKKFETIMKITRVITRIIFIVLIVSITALFIAFIVTLFLPADLLTFDVSSMESFRVTLMNIQFRLTSDIFQGEVAFKQLIITGIFAGLVHMIYFGGIIMLIAKILDDVSKKTPFSDGNVRRLFYVSYAFILGAILLPVFINIFGWQVIHAFNIDDATVSYSMHTNWLFTGALIWILANIFQYGLHLQDEVDSTI